MDSNFRVMGRKNVAAISHIWMLSFLITCSARTQNTCADISGFSNLLHGKSLAGSEFKTFPNTTFIVCVKQCQLRSRCVSINFERSTGDCVLNEGGLADTQLNFTDLNESVYSEVDGWPKSMIGVCASHTCPENSVCMENGSGGSECMVESCKDPPSLENAVVTSSSRFIEVGSVVPYVCAPPYISAGERTCLPNGRWSGEVQCINMRHCNDVKICNSSSKDGEYWMYVHQDGFHLLKVYCHNMMQDTDPVPYLTLHGNNTYSVFPSPATAETCNADSENKPCGKTVFHRVRFYPWTLRVSMFKYTFAKTDCKMSPLGWAGDCQDCKAESAGGSFQIDTTGTGVKMSPNIMWVKNDTGHILNVTRSDDGMVVSGNCRGGCVTCIPAVEDVHPYTVSVLVAPTSNLDLTTAIFPKCSLPTTAETKYVDG